MQNFAAIRNTKSRSREMTFGVAIFGSFPDIPELKLSLPSWVMEGRMWRCKMYVLQSYHSCTFCKHKTRGETQFWIELAVPCTLANQNEINSDIIIFLPPSLAMARIASGVNAWCYRHVFYDVINKRNSASFGRLPAENAERFVESLNDFVFIDISAFTAYFAFRFFVYCFFSNRVTISYINCIHSNNTLKWTERKKKAYFDFQNVVFIMNTKFVFLTVIYTHIHRQLNSSTNFFNFCWWHFSFAMTSLPRTGVHRLYVKETRAQKQIIFEENGSLNNFPP